MDKGNKIVNENIFITTPIYYVNAEPSIGSVYATLMANNLVNFYKLSSKKTYFLTGTDEHGQKIQQSAEKLNMKEQDYVDKVSKMFRDTANRMKFTYNDFIRTTDDRHKIFVQNIWRQLVKNDWLYKGKYEGWYCVSDEAYYGEDELIKQEDGSFKTDLGKSVEWKEEESYFFRLSEFQDILLSLYENTSFIEPESRKNETVAFVSGTSIKEVKNGNYVKGFLKDLSVSRNNFSWGIKIPCDENGRELIDNVNGWKENIKEEDKHVIYVWLDALFNYQSALESKNILEEFWNRADVIHIVGKEISRFHAVYWPAFLMAVKYSRQEIKTINVRDIISNNILPKMVFAHGWWTVEGKKMSKSLGNAISANSELQWLMDEFSIDEDTAVDYLRYYLSTEIALSSDGDYSKGRVVDRVNAELVNNIGNLVQRVLSMIYKNFNGKIDCKEYVKVDNLENKLKNETLNIFDIQGYKDLVIDISNEANDYMEKMAPWNLKKENRLEEMRNILYREVESIRKIAILLQLLCPTLARKVLDFLQVEEKNRNFESLYDENCMIKNVIIGEPKGFFPRLKKD